MTGARAQALKLWKESYISKISVHPREYCILHNSLNPTDDALHRESSHKLTVGELRYHRRAEANTQFYFRSIREKHVPSSVLAYFNEE